MTLSQLEYIVALDTYKSFVLAAEKSMITQPTLSMQIKKLESDLGVILFDRSKNPIVATKIGKTIVEQARIVLREADQIQESIKEYKQKIGGNLQIGVIPTIAPYLLPYFLGPFSKRFPEINLEIKELKTEEIVELLQMDLLDAGILATPLHEPTIQEEPLFYEEILLYVNPKHALSYEEKILPEQLLSSDLWMLTKGNCFRDHVINLCKNRSEQPLSNLRYESGSIETLKKMVDVEGGYTLLPELAAIELPSKEGRRLRHFVEPKPLREVSLVFARKASKRNLLQRIKEVILPELPNEIKNKERGHLVEWK
ncbi:MAG: LysR substrate-binding domain-containing protein [Chitinophagales bacterium]